MVERRVSPEINRSYAHSFIASARKVLSSDEPAKFHEFIEILQHIIAHRDDLASCFARVAELMKDHRDLLLGFNEFLPAGAKMTIPPDANKGLGQLQTVVGRRVPPELTMDDVCSYVADVKEAFRDEPGKYKEFLKIFKDYNAQRLDVAGVTAKLEELVKDHEHLLRGVSVFLPYEAKRTVPPEAKSTILPDANKGLAPVVGRREPPELTKPDPYSYIAAVKEAFSVEPAKYDEFVKIMQDYTAQRLDVAGVTAKLEELVKDHEHLLRGVSVFLPAEAKRTIPPEAKANIIPKPKRKIPPEAEHHGDESNGTKRKRTESDRESFMNNLKTRFRRLDTDKVESFLEIMKMYEEGKKSPEEVQEEVVDLLYYHEDLIEEFSRCFIRKRSYS